MNIVFFLLFLCASLFAQDVVELAIDHRARGDHFFQKKDYYLAFEKYRKAFSFQGLESSLHYRLGRIYGLLEPQQSLCEKEYTVALTLFLKKFAEIEQVNLKNFRELMSIPIDPYESSNPTWVNPILFVKRDVDGDGQKECFVMMKRGHLSYALFVIDYFDYLPRVTHLVSFYEGESGRADLRFKDLTQDGREEIIVVSEMKDFLNLFIFAKSPVQTYQEILNLPGLFLGTHIFANVKGDSKKEVEVHEKIRKGIIFPQDEGPYLTRKIIYMWNGEVYKDVHTEMVYDEGYALNKFFGALMLEENYDKAYRHISPEKFFRRLDRHNDQEALRHYFKRGDYNIFLASHPNINSLIGQIKLYRDLRFDNTEGWEEGGNAAPRSQSVRDDERYYKLIVGQASYSLVMRNRGRWRIEHFVKDDVRDGGWA